MLAGHAVDLHKDLTREQEKGVNDEWLKEDIAKAEEYVRLSLKSPKLSVPHPDVRVLKDVETYCAKLSKQGFMKRYITQSQKRKDRLGVLIARFEAMRANLTVCVSSLPLDVNADDGTALVDCVRSGDASVYA